MWSLETTSVTRKQLHSLALGNHFRETNAGELPEVKSTAAGCGNCWKLRRVTGKVRNMTENDLSILIVIFSYNYNKQRPQTESCVLFCKDHSHTGISMAGAEL